MTVHLRGPEGCPWDRAQDYDTLKALLLEEAYEVVDAVNGRDFSGLEDELGDLLFLVVFYSRMAEEEGRFTVEDVVDHVHAKLIGGIRMCSAKCGQGMRAKRCKAGWW